MASLTKIMTCHLVLELAKKNPEILDETITVSERAAAVIGTSANLIAGDRLKVQDSLYALMLPSGNDAAVAIAEHFSARLRRRRRLARQLVRMQPNEWERGERGFDDMRPHPCCLDADPREPLPGVAGKKTAGKNGENAGVFALSLPLETPADRDVITAVGLGEGGGDSTLAWVCDMNATAQALANTHTNI